MKNNDDLLSVQGPINTLVDKEGYLVRQDINGERKRYPFEISGTVSGDKISAYVGPVDIESNYSTSYNNNVIQGSGGDSFTLRVGDFDGGHSSKKTTYTYVQGDTIYIQGYNEANFYYGTSSSNGLKINSSGLKYKGHDLNTASGLVQLNANAKIPSGLIPELNYLPTNGGTIEGKVTVNDQFNVTDKVIFDNELEVNDDALFKLNLEVEEGLSAQTLNVTTDATISGVSFIGLYNTVGTANNTLENI